VNWVLDDIKSHIVGWEKEESRWYILRFPEISSVNIKITPIWYNTIPKLKSRIKVEIE
jgi:RNA processing factor Prp31